MDFDADPVVEVAAKKESNFVVLTKEKIVEEQLEQINKISELFDVRGKKILKNGVCPAERIPTVTLTVLPCNAQVRPATARQLLTYMKWNADKLIERYYEGDAEKIFKDGGIADPNAGGVRVTLFFFFLFPLVVSRAY